MNARDNASEPVPPAERDHTKAGGAASYDGGSAQGDPGQGRQTQGKQGQGRQGQGRQGQGKQGQGRQGQGKQGQGKQGQGKQGQGKQGQAKQAQGKQTQSRQGQGKQAQGRQGSGKQAQGSQVQVRDRQAPGRHGHGRGESVSVTPEGAGRRSVSTEAEAPTDAAQERDSDRSTQGWMTVERDFAPVVRALVQQAFLVALVPVLVVALLSGWLVHWAITLPVLLLGGVAAWFWAAGRVRGGRAAVLAELGAVPATEEQHARLLNLVDGLRLRMGIDAPEVLVLDDPAANGLSLADESGTTLLVTTGLLNRTDRIGLEAVVAHLLAALRSGAAAAGTAGVAAFGQAMSAGGKGDAWWRSAAGERPRLELDFMAVSQTRYPPGMVRALSAIAEGPVLPALVPEWSIHLWLASGTEDVDAVKWRIATLEEL